MNLANVETKPTLTRLRRAHGQLAAVIRLIEEDADCEKVVQQLAATSKAIDKAGYLLIASSLKQCVLENGADSVDIAKLEKLFLSLS